MADLNKKSKSAQQSSVGSSTAPRHPVFFLYSKIGQNETKSLKKAATNKKERQVLAEIFDLTGALDTSHPQHKVQVLRLDFHYINYTFCKENQFSNEKISTLLAILDEILCVMLEKSRTHEQGLAMLRKCLEDHSKQRPPYSILIFSQEEIQKIQKFSVETLFRHYSLYEFAFKPRVELILRTAPVINDKFNAQLRSLDSMVEVEAEEADRLKAFLGNTDADNMDFNQSEIHTSSHPQVSTRSHAGISQRSDNRSVVPTSLKHGNDDVSEIQHAGEKDDSTPLGGKQEIDWQKVGRVHQADSKLEDVVEKEMRRLNKALETKLAIQHETIGSTTGSVKK